MDKNIAIEKYKKVVTAAYETMIEGQCLWQEARLHNAQYFNNRKSEKELVEEFKSDLQARVINRYTSPGYSETRPETIGLETKIWEFARDNPELWAEITTHIAWGETDINTYMGFTFLDCFVHNGVLDDWDLVVIEKNNQVYFVSDEGQDFKALTEDVKHTRQWLNQDVMQSVLDKLSTPKIDPQKMKM